MNWFWFVVAFIFGAVVGSFLNLCIWRLPRDESIISPGSKCTVCQKPLRIWHNIPLISYLILRGKCYYCHSLIPVRYFLIELISAILSAYLLYYFHFTFYFFYSLTLLYLLIIVFFIDLEHQLILDKITFLGIFLGLAGSFFMPASYYYKVISFINTTSSPVNNFLNALTGALAGGIFFYLIREVGTFLAKEEALGLGDVKLAILIGAFLGPVKGLTSFILAFFLGAVVAVPLLLFKKKTYRDPIPFGTFMAVSTLIVLIYGEHLIKLYLLFPYFCGIIRLY